MSFFNVFKESLKCLLEMGGSSYFSEYISNTRSLTKYLYRAAAAKDEKEMLIKFISTGLFKILQMKTFTMRSIESVKEYRYLIFSLLTPRRS